MRDRVELERLRLAAWRRIGAAREQLLIAYVAHRSWHVPQVQAAREAVTRAAEEHAAACDLLRQLPPIGDSHNGGD